MKIGEEAIYNNKLYTIKDQIDVQMENSILKILELSPTTEDDPEIYVKAALVQEAYKHDFYKALSLLLDSNSVIGIQNKLRTYHIISFNKNGDLCIIDTRDNCSWKYAPNKEDFNQKWRLFYENR